MSEMATFSELLGELEEYLELLKINLRNLNRDKLTFNDIERCPYVPGEPGYVDWIKKDDERLERIQKSRE
jgi:hypothetical protein